jgi:TrpR family trp operon transcriptional repressor
VYLCNSTFNYYQGKNLNKAKKRLEGFIDLCLSSRNERLFEALFDLFLTEEEKSDLALRYLIVKELLKKEKSQREIAKNLNVSIAKITRGSNELKRIDEKLLKHLKDKLS